MESFKHSCPCCGQHIEYTAGYCGQQMQCPMCGKTVTFPAIPPKRTGPILRARGVPTEPAPKWSLKLPAGLGFPRDFQHWNVVAQCAVPFLLIAALLAGAVFVKNKLAAPADEPAAPAVQADPGAWQKMADLNKADQAVKDSMKVLAAAHAQADQSARLLAQARKLEPEQQPSAQAQAQRAQQQLLAARQQFDKANTLYHQLGGAVDYRSQCPNY
jgi:hypothetical protein